jgi:hypothetical protein
MSVTSSSGREIARFGIQHRGAAFELGTERPDGAQPHYQYLHLSPDLPRPTATRMLAFLDWIPDEVAALKVRSAVKGVPEGHVRCRRTYGRQPR